MERPWVDDVAEAAFDLEVVERSCTTPVVADFWAPWCAPCRALTPLLEEVIGEHKGAVILARINVDEAPALTAELGIRGIPAVKGYRDGAVLAEFSGAQPVSVIRQLVAAVLPTGADRLAAEGERCLAAAAAGAEGKFRDALATDPHHGRALLGLARVLAARGEPAEALDLLARVLPSASVAAEAERFAAEVRTGGEADGDESGLRRRIGANPSDLAARIELGRLLAARRRYEEALGELLTAVRHDRHFEDDAGRRAMIDIFTLLGVDDPLTTRFQSDLARILYS
jgi:putative thioredoxin